MRPMVRPMLMMTSLVLLTCSGSGPRPPDDEEPLREGRAALSRGQVDRAVALLGRAVQRRPGHVESRRQLAKALLAANRGRDAERCLREGLKGQPRSVVLWLDLGQLLARQGKHDQAVRALEEARHLSPEEVEVALALGQIYEQHGQTDVARALYRSSLPAAEVAARIRLHRRLARLAALREEHGEVLAELRRALALAPQRGDLQAELGVALRRSGRSAEAKIVLVQAARMRPRDGEVRLQLGLVLAELEEHAAAEEALAEASRLLPGRSAPLAALCESQLVLGRRDVAYGTCVRALALAPADARMQWRMAPLYLERGLVEPAGELLDQLAGARAHDADYWALVARVAEGRGDHGAARESWAKALTLRPRDLLLRRHLGFAARRAGDYPGALVHLEAVQRERPDDYDTLVHLGIAAEFCGQRRRAAEVLGRAEGLAPGRPEALVYLAWLAQRQGRLPEALTRAERADRLARGTSVPALDVLASVLSARGRRAEAMAVIDRALALPLGAGDRSYLAARRLALEGKATSPKREVSPGAPSPREEEAPRPGVRAEP